MTALPIMARCPSRSVRQARMRCTSNWSVPWDAMPKMAPPAIAATQLNGLVSTGAVKFSTSNLPAA